jgi:hypothetical protein
MSCHIRNLVHALSEICPRLGLPEITSFPQNKVLCLRAIQYKEKNTVIVYTHFSVLENEMINSN